MKPLIDYDGQLFIDFTLTGISPLIFITDGLRLLTFNNHRNYFCSVVEVLNWYNKNDYTMEGTLFFREFSRILAEYNTNNRHSAKHEAPPEQINLSKELKHL